MAKIFLSYAREDIARVRSLAESLEAAGHSVWWDQHISGGDRFSQAIEQALEAADVVVVVWSNSSCNSPWVLDEAASGRDSNRLIPLSFDGCRAPLGFRQIQTIDLRGWNCRANSETLEPVKLAIDSKIGMPIRGRPAKTPTGFGEWRKWSTRASLVAVSCAALLMAAMLLPQIRAMIARDSVIPKVALGQFAVLSPDLPPSMSRAMHDEILAAFGVENAVAVTAEPGVSPGRAVPFLLEGSIRKDADALRLTVNLKDTRSGTILWTRAFDRAAADGLASRQVAVAASQVVRCGLWGGSAYPRRMPDQALTLYLQLCNEQWGGSPDDQRVLEAARRVTVALPDFSFGWSALALASVPLSHGPDRDAAMTREKGLAAARRATRLDDDNPEGYMAEAGLLPIDRFAEREALLVKAISVRPTECGCERVAYGDFLTSVGRMDEAVEQYTHAQAIMPLSPAVTLRLAHALYVSGQQEAADRITADMLQIWPDAIALRQVRLKSAMWTKRYAEALAMLKEPGLHLTQSQMEALRSTFEALLSNDPDSKAAAAMMLVAMARDERRNDRLVVAALAALGAQSAAIAAAEKLIEERGHPLADVLFEPNLAAASGRPEYSALVGKLGLARYWRAAKNPPDICRRETRPGFCAVA